MVYFYRDEVLTADAPAAEKGLGAEDSFSMNARRTRDYENNRYHNGFTTGERNPSHGNNRLRKGGIR